MDRSVRYELKHKCPPHPARVSCRSLLNECIRNIKSMFSEGQLARFASSCFGHFLAADDKLKFSGPLLHQLLLRQGHSEDDHRDGMVIMLSNSQVGRLSKKDFALITGLRFGKKPQINFNGGGSVEEMDSSSRLKGSYFRNRKHVTRGDLELVFMSCHNSEDKYCLGLLYFVNFVLLGKQRSNHIDLRFLKLAENVEDFCNFPWGTVSYNMTMESFKVNLQARYERAEKEGRPIDYELYGFPFALQVWAYECLPSIAANADAIKVSEDALPRMLRWRNSGGITFKHIMSNVLVFDEEDLDLGVIHPSRQEISTSYWDGRWEEAERLEEPLNDENKQGIDNRCHAMGSTSFANVSQPSFPKETRESSLADMLQAISDKWKGELDQVRNDIVAETRAIVRGELAELKELVAEMKCLLGPSAKQQGFRANSPNTPRNASPIDGCTSNQGVDDSQEIPPGFENFEPPHLARTEAHSEGGNVSNVGVLEQCIESIPSAKGSDDPITVDISKIYVAADDSTVGMDASNIERPIWQKEKETDDFGGLTLDHKNYADTYQQFVQVVAKWKDDPTVAIDKGNEEGDPTGDDSVDIIPSSDFVPRNLAVQLPEGRGRRLKKRANVLKPPFTGPAKKRKTGTVPMKFDPLGQYSAVVVNEFIAFIRWWDDHPRETLYVGNGVNADRKFFHQLLTPAAWLGTDHIETALLLIRKRQLNHPDIFGTRWTTVDCGFPLLVTACFTGPKLYRTRHAKANLSIPTSVLTFVAGTNPSHGKAWAEVDKVFCPFNVSDKHWCAVVIDLVAHKLCVYDSNIDLHADRKMVDALQPMCTLLPTILRDGGFYDARPELECDGQSWVVDRVPGVPQQTNGGDCGVFTLKFIELLSAGLPLECCTQDNMCWFRLRLAVDMYSRNAHV